MKDNGFNIVYLETDPDFIINVIDFNYTAISMYLNFSGNWSDYPEYCNYSIEKDEVKCKFKLEEKWQVWNETTQDLEEHELEYEQEFELEDNISKEKIEFRYNDNPFGKKFKFGGNSTVIQLVDANTENLDDTYISNYMSNTVKGSDSQLYIGNIYWQGVWNDLVRSMLKFNITSLTNINTEIDVIDSSLNLYIYTNTFENGDNEIIEVYEYNNFTWTEEQLTWNGFVTSNIGSMLDTNNTIQNQNSLWLNFNVSTWTNHTIENDYNNVSFFVNVTETTDTEDYIKFYSKEYTTDITKRPYLNITYNRYAAIDKYELYPVSPYTTNDLILNMTCTSDLPPVTAYWYIYKNDVLQSSLSGSMIVTTGTETVVKTIGHGNTSKTENWLAEAWCGISIFNTTKHNTSTRTILNTLPPLPTGLTDLGMWLTNHTSRVNWTNGVDDDGDTITTTVHVGTTSTPTSQETSTLNEFAILGNTIPLSDSITYYYRLRSWDGTEYSSSYTASDQFRMNDEPTTVQPNIVPSTAYSTTSELMCENGTTTDPEDDVITFHYEWYRNDIPLTLDLKNISNSNYSPNDVMICEIWVSDPYETNTTKLNSTSVTITPIVPVINSNTTYLANHSTDLTPSYDETIHFNVNITDSDNDISGVWFTLLSPNGTNVIDSVNGTVYNSDLWNSTTYTIDDYGDWQINITVNDTTGLEASQQWNFTVNLGTLTKSIDEKTYSQKSGETESFNITFSHTGNSNNTINITEFDDMADVNKFNITYWDADTNIQITNNFTVQESESYILKINITSNATLLAGSHLGNITFERVNDNTKSNLTVSVTLSTLTGNVILTPTSWGISMDSASSISTTFNIENDGDYNLSYCNGSISGWSSYDTYNTTSFSVENGSSVDMLVTLSNIPAATYSKLLLVECIATSNNGIDTDTTSISAIISQYTAPTLPPGGGGGGGDELPESVCGNGLCEWDETWNESDKTRIYCPEDCLVLADNVTLIFDIKPPFYTVITRPDSTIKHTFKIENYNPKDYVMHVYVACQPDDESCTWINLDADGILDKELYVTVPGGNIDQPGVKLVDYIINVPTDTSYDLHRLSITITNSTYGYIAVLPVTMDMRFGFLTWLWLWIMNLGTGFTASCDITLVPFERSLFGIEEFTMLHVYIILFFVLIIVGIYLIYRYSQKYKKGKGKKYFEVDLGKGGIR